MSHPPPSSPVRSSDLGDEFIKNLTAQQTELLTELTLSAYAAETYSDLVNLTIGFFEQIGAGASNCAIFDNQDLSLVGFSSSMRLAVIEQVQEEGIGGDDPLLTRLERSDEPAIVGFGLGITEEWRTSNAERFIQISQMHGYYGLLFIPVRLRGGPYSAAITIATELDPDAAHAFLEENCTFMLMAARTLGSRAAHLFQPGSTDDLWHPRRSEVLSPRERQVVVALSRGNRPDQIAHELTIKPVTVHMHVASARQKLGARTREQLVSLAIQKGLI